MLEITEKEIINNRGQIRAILGSILNDSVLVRVCLGNQPEEYSSIMLSIDDKHRIITFDELHPIDGHYIISKGTGFTINTRNSGVETRFSSKVKEIGIEDGVHFYKLKWPKELIYSQKRAAFRVPTTQDFSGEVEFTSAEGLLINKAKGRLQDISATGFGGLVANDSLELGKNYKAILFFQKTPPINAVVEIKFLGISGSRGTRRFGAVFVSVEGGTSKIPGLVNRIERDLIRRGSL